LLPLYETVLMFSLFSDKAKEESPFEFKLC